MQKIAPCLWFDNDAEEAAKFYVSVFPHSKIGTIARYGKSGAAVSGRREGSVMTVTFELDRQEFMALNGGPQFKFSPAISLMVNCETQREVDEMWEKLSEGGKKSRCGWLDDKFGVSWQIVPTVIAELMGGDPQGVERMMAALLKMDRLEIETLKRAYAG